MSESDYMAESGERLFIGARVADAYWSALGERVGALLNDLDRRMRRSGKDGANGAVRISPEEWVRLEPDNGRHKTLMPASDERKLARDWGLYLAGTHRGASFTTRAYVYKSALWRCQVQSGCWAIQLELAKNWVLLSVIMLEYSGNNYDATRVVEWGRANQDRASAALNAAEPINFKYEIGRRSAGPWQDYALTKRIAAVTSKPFDEQPYEAVKKGFMCLSRPERFYQRFVEPVIARLGEDRPT